MVEINFCPFCNAPQHKIVDFVEKYFFCKDCNRFFTLDLLELTCPKCNSKKVQDSDFPTPDGLLVIQCSSCKKMYSAKEFLQKNKIL
ncbi:MAG: hypothetical protein V1740_04060 [Candidatus Woesearchaeota archaeon]